MGQATSNQANRAKAQHKNKAGLPQDLTNQPPIKPPTKKPKDCKVL